MAATTFAPPSSRATGVEVAPGRRSTPGNRARSVTGRVLMYGGLLAAAVFLLLPFYWMLTSSLKSEVDIFTVPVKWLPTSFVWENYVEIWSRSEMSTWLGNTILLSVVVTFLQVLTGSFAAYGFAKARFPGRNALFLAYVATIAVPWTSYMIPQYILMSRVGLANTLWAIIVLQAFGAFGVFLMKQYYETIPEELSEAARIDGLSEYGIWRKIILPLSKPALASLALLTFVNTWNDYLGPVIYLRNRDLWTMQIGLQTFISDPQRVQEWSMIMTGSVISVLPIAIIFMLGQRYFVQGIASTGLKG